MIESFHRPIKEPLKAYSTNQWTVALLTILLGFRTVFKKDIQARTAALVNETSLQFPGELFVPTVTDTTPQQFAEELKLYFRSIRPVPASRHGAK